MAPSPPPLLPQCYLHFQKSANRFLSLVHAVTKSCYRPSGSSIELYTPPPVISPQGGKYPPPRWETTRPPKLSVIVSGFLNFKYKFEFRGSLHRLNIFQYPPPNFKFLEITLPPPPPTHPLPTPPSTKSSHHAVRVYLARRHLPSRE